MSEGFRLAPKSEQPADGYMHKDHLLAYGPPHMAWRGGWVQENTYCIAPSSSLYDKRFLR